MEDSLENIRLFRSKLRILERELERQLLSETGCCGVLLSHCHILMELAGRDEISITELAEIVELDKSTLSRTIDGMVKPDMVNRQTDHKDRRKVVITVTQEGKKKINEINQQCDSYYNRLFEQIPLEHHQQVVEVMQLLSSAMIKLKKKSKICCLGN